MNLNVDGLDELIRKLESVEANTDELARRAVYVGAGIVADEIRKGIEGLPVEETASGRQPYGTEANPINGITGQQKADLAAGLGIARMESKGGEVSTSIGFSGTGSTTSRRYPGGVPNAAFMRTVESGSSFRKKHPVIRQAVNRAKKIVVDAMEREILEQLRKEL